jgi:hypothetical protein
MNIQEFIAANNLQPADAVVVQKEKFGILDHYVIYLGQNGSGEHIFIANFTEGVKFITYWKILEFMNQYVPVRVNRFLGDYIQRNLAVQRALSRLNENSYNLILNNCEHFKNYVHHGVKKSEQVQEFGAALLVTGIGAAAVGAGAKKKEVTIAGLITAGLGLIAIGLSEQ